MDFSARLSAGDSGRVVVLEIDDPRAILVTGSGSLSIHIHSRAEAEALLYAASRSLAMMHPSYPLRSDRAPNAVGATSPSPDGSPAAAPVGGRCERCSHNMDDHAEHGFGCTAVLDGDVFCACEVTR